MSADIYINADCCGAHDHNITHNLAPMFRAAGVDWHDYSGQSRKASELLRDIKHALTSMADQPDKYRAMNPPNGWGNYEGGVAFLVGLAIDCLTHPEGTVEVSL